MKLVYGNPYDSWKHPELHAAWNAGRDEARRVRERPPIKEEPVIAAKTAVDLLKEGWGIN